MPPALTVEQAQDLVDHFGGQIAAANGVGISRSTIRWWLNPEKYRALRQARYHRDPERERQRIREHYHNLSGLEYNRLLLRHRRNKALQRITEREQRRQED